MRKKTKNNNSLECIQIIGARQHNLKNISINIPRNKLVVITGLSGSGKSSLAFDTIYAEGQRRYVESLSSYARQFLDMMEKPDVDLIEGLSPAISIEQKTTSKNPRSTVGTVTEIYDYMRLLFARIGKPYSPTTGKEIKSQSVSEIVDSILGIKKGTKFLLLAPIVNNRKGEFKKEILEFQRKGFIRFKIDGEIYTIENIPDLDKNKKHSLQIVIDRLEVKESFRSRISESVETGLNISDGVIYIENIENSEVNIYSSKFACPVSGFTIEEIEPRLFSFNSPNGACENCDGLGYKEEFDEELIIGNTSLSLENGVILPWNKKNNTFYSELIKSVADHLSIQKSTRWCDLDEEIKKKIIHGTGKDIQIRFSYFRNNQTNKKFNGVIGFLKTKLARSDLWQREELSKYLNKFVCNKCNGSRLKEEAIFIKIDNKNIFDIKKLSISDSLNWFTNIEKKLKGNDKEISKKIIKEIKNRLLFLQNVGLDYLNLSRSSSTLSGGENQRIRLASQIGSGLTGVLYVLDEPSIGLHQKDNVKLINALKRLRDLGNTVIVVEHDTETMENADHIIDLGPEAGTNGGQISSQGTYEEIKKDKNSITGQYLANKKKIDIPNIRRLAKNGRFVEINGATGNNLNNVNLKIPTGTFTCVTGVSGSGKSTLILQTLFHALNLTLNNKAKKAPKAFKGYKGVELIDKIIDIDQSPIGRTPRSNPATYTGAFGPIRDWFTSLPESKTRGYKPGRFSFNVKGGRCEACEGDGVITYEMHFLPDVYIQCDECKGTRYNRETLEIKFKDKSIADVLDMSVDEGCEYFENISNIKTKLLTLKKVGLGYIKIGQQATTLSGGEAQRIKLAKELSKRSTGRTMYILDEPTTGLHQHDIKKLLEILHTFVKLGNTVVVIEHNLDVIKTADYIVDMGPEGGIKGGKIIAEGKPEEISKIKESYTGQFLKPLLANS